MQANQVDRCHWTFCVQVKILKYLNCITIDKKKREFVCHSCKKAIKYKGCSHIVHHFETEIHAPFNQKVLKLSHIMQDYYAMK